MYIYGVIFGPYFPVFGLNTEKYGPEITPYLDTFDGVNLPKWVHHENNFLLKYTIQTWAKRENEMMLQNNL